MKSKSINYVVIFLFALLLILPVIAFRFGTDIVSEIDNRKLAENPFSVTEREKGGNYIAKLENYINDRIGFRDEMIMVYTIINDKLFNEMVHPSYRYGKDGYVFFRNMTSPEYGEFHEDFADMVSSIQDYCETRSIPFLFVFEPAKTSALSQYLPDGVRYDNSWVEQLFLALDARGVHYIDNSAILKERIDAGEAVFNRKYDAGHWNDLGAYYGVNAMLNELNKAFPGIKPNDISEFEVSNVLQTTLPVSMFPIHEYVPLIAVPMDNVEYLTEIYESEVECDPSYQYFQYTLNHDHLADTPRTLVFQGSYMNGKGYKYLSYALGEYIAIHDYQNILNFPYYFNVFKPNCVVFEVAEYTLTNGYFNEEKMKTMKLNPPLSAIQNSAKSFEELILDNESISSEIGNKLITITWKTTDDSIDYAWACVNDVEYDMRFNGNDGYEVTISNNDWEHGKKALAIVVLKNNELYMMRPSPVVG